MPIATEMRILQMYGSDAGQPPRSLYTKGLSPFCDICMYIPYHVQALYRVYIQVPHMFYNFLPSLPQIHDCTLGTQNAQCMCTSGVPIIHRVAARPIIHT